MPVVDVDGVLEQDRKLHQGALAGAVQLALQVGIVAGHLRYEPLLPPVREVLAVGRKDGGPVLADHGGVARVPRHPRGIARPVLGRLDEELRIRRDDRGVHVAVDELGEPVGCEVGPETPEHVVAAEPPAADVREHGAQRVRAVQVVEYPEQLLLGFRLPLYRELVVAQESPEHIFGRTHGSSSLSALEPRRKMRRL